VRPVFTPYVDDPQAFDRDGLTYLRNRYLSLLSEIRLALLNGDWFDSTALNSSVQQYIPWSVVARQLLVGFACAEALGVMPKDLMGLWVEYATVRILPIAAMNVAMEAENLQKCRSGCLQVAKTCSYLVAAQARGYVTFGMVGHGSRFRDVYFSYLKRISQIAYDDLSSRYSNEFIRDPETVLSTYQTDLSPLLRRSTLETFANGLGGMVGRVLRNPHWPTCYEQLSQLLDDLSDIGRDVCAGRLTYPILLGLNNKEIRENLAALISNLWATQRGNSDNVFKKIWPIIVTDLKKAGTFLKIVKQAEAWCKDIQCDILSEDFPGNTDPLFVVIDLKKALLYRLQQNEFSDKQPEFEFF
jgi:hypothetical protein